MSGILFNSPVFAGNVFEDLSSLDKDTYVHFSAGVIISHISYPIFKEYMHDDQKAVWYSFLLTSILSLAKEIYDKDRTGFNGTDLAAGILGGSTVFVVRF